jgi:transposase
MQKNTEVLSGLVLGHKSDGRCRYDPLVKQELIRQCLKPGVSVARMAMQHGMNANLLRTWISKAQRAIAKQMLVAQVSAPVAPRFVPVKLETAQGSLNPPPAIKAPQPADTATLVRMQVRLPNGVSIDLSQAPLQELGDVMLMLSALPCSS